MESIFLVAHTHTHTQNYDAEIFHISGDGDSFAYLVRGWLLLKTRQRRFSFLR